MAKASTDGADSDTAPTETDVVTTAADAVTDPVPAPAPEPDPAPEPAPQPEAAAAAPPVLPTTFAAPEHVTAIYFSTGREIEVTDGTLTAPDDLSDDERLQLTRAGFVPA